MEPSFDLGYEKMVDSTKQWEIDHHTTKLMKQTKWVVTEKVHGSNFCIVYSIADKTVSFAKRRAVVEKGESFFGHETIALDVLVLEQIWLYLQPKVVLQSNSWSSLLIFGEIFGGLYPHESVPKQDQFQPVQTGIYYSPKIEYMIFDMALVNDKQEKVYVDYDLVLDVCHQHQLLVAEPLSVGKFEECMEFPLPFQSKIPAMLKLPPIPNNKAEGVVIKPMKTIMIPLKKGMGRAIIKRKIEEFKEEKYDQAEKWKSDSTFNSNNDTLQMILYELYALVNENRLNNVISKWGRPTKANLQTGYANQLKDYLEKDVMEQLTDSYAEEMKQLSSQDTSSLQNELTTLCKKEIVAYAKKHSLL